MVIRLELLVATFVTGGFLLVGQAFAQGTPNADCETLVQSPFDPETPAGEGVDLADIDGDAAVPACQAALVRSPDDARTIYHLGRAFDAAGDYERAVVQYEQAADSGNLLAMNALGSLYDYGNGVDLDPAKAADYYAQAADGGLVLGMENLAKAYETGRGVAQDYAMSAELYAQAMEAGSAWAAGNLGWQTENGYGVEQDEVEAVRLYRIAADAGEAFAQHNMGWMYSNGRGGLEADETKAVEYYRKAAKQGWPRSLLSLSWYYSNGVVVDRNPITAEFYLRETINAPDVEQDIKADALNNLAWLFAMENTDLDEAETLSRESVALEPDDANHIDTLAWVLHLLDRSEEALPYIQEARGLEPDNADFKMHFDAIKLALK